MTPRAEAAIAPAPLGVWTVPNLITTTRLACLPLFLYLMFGRSDRGAAAVVLGVIGATDWIDGHVARRFGQVSAVGKVLDPAADRVVFLVGAIALIVDGSVPLGFAVATLVRESIVALGALLLVTLKARRIDVTYVGKCATFGLLSAFPLFLAGASDLFFHRATRIAAWVIGIPSLVLSYYAAAGYLPLARRAVAERGATPSHGTP
jgi:cardiolipin synthase